jgi:multicomponent K+:H+ antiporter subunit E/multicomponent Na+:H+ antiporter subunit E
VQWRPQPETSGAQSSSEQPHVESKAEQPPTPLLTARLLGFWPFAAVALLEVLKGSAQVIAAVLRGGPRTRSGLVEVPLEGHSRAGAVVTGWVVTLSPGSVLVDIDWKRRLMIFHLVEAGDPDRVRATYSRLYRKYQRRVFP